MHHHHVQPPLFTNLPPDISLYVLSFLPAPSICALAAVSRASKVFLDTHEDGVFHQLCVVCRFVESGRALEDVQGVSEGDGKSWKALCESNILLCLIGSLNGLCA